MGPTSPSICFYYPIVVLDGKLFRASIAPDGLQLEEADAVPVALNYRSPAYPEHESHTILVVRASAFDAEVVKLDQWLAETAGQLRTSLDAFEIPSGEGVVAETPNQALQPTSPARKRSKAKGRSRAARG